MMCNYRNLKIVIWIMFDIDMLLDDIFFNIMNFVCVFIVDFVKI